MKRDKTCIIVGGGNSLRNFNFNKLRTKADNKLPIFAMNEVFIELYRQGIRADFWTFWDKNFYDRRQAVINEFYNTGQEVHTIDRYGFKDFVTWEIDKEPKLCRRSGAIGNMNSSLAMCINIALHKGFETILLLGFDNFIAGNYEHWYNKEPISPERKKNHNEFAFKRFANFVKDIKADLRDDERLVGVASGFDFIDNTDFKTFSAWLEEI